MDKQEKSQNHNEEPDKNKKSDLKPDSGKIFDTPKENKKVDNNVIEKEMEVHVKPKENKEFKVKPFLYEFFIIFLAVSLSFFVENIRERYIEHHKEVQYIKSLFDDVQLDTTKLASAINHNQLRFEAIDTLLRELEKPNSKKIVNYLYYYPHEYISGVSLFFHTDRTIAQLKNSGGLRLIQSKTASDNIVDYYSSVQRIEFNGDYLIKFMVGVTEQEEELLDFKFFRTKNIKSLLTKSDLKLRSNDSKRIILFYNKTFNYKNMLDSYGKSLEELKKQATQLLETLKKEYKLK